MADRGRLTANLAAVGVLVAVATGVLLWQRPWSERTSDVVATVIPDNHRVLLAQTFRDLTEAESREDFVAAAGRSHRSRVFATSVWDARARLGADRVRMVYEQGGDAADRPDGSTSARVTVGWTPSADSVFAGARPLTSTVRFRLIPRSDGFDVVAADGFGHDRLPLWLAGPIRVQRDVGSVTVRVGTSPGCSGVPARARAAIVAVQRVQPEIHQTLVVVCPDRPATTAALLGSSARDVDQIAAISTNLGGVRGTPAVVLNPKLFAGMDVRARQVVMSHEATHVLTGLIGADLDRWVAEGYADFVALRDDRKSLAVSAGQILDHVRVSGAPKALPTDADFDESAHGLGAAYESAWLVFRMLDERFGEPAVTAFYRDVVAGMSVQGASARNFGWSVAELTAAWRTYLTKSASTVS